MLDDFYLTTLFLFPPLAMATTLFFSHPHFLHPHHYSHQTIYLSVPFSHFSPISLLHSTCLLKFPNQLPLLSLLHMLVF
ncbi:hypothetical protein Hanom_Chr03g00220301 [Helianthus anomalus]